MNKNIIVILVIGVIIAVLLAGGLLFINQQNNSEGKMMVSSEKMMNTANSKYFEYDSSALQNNSDKKVLFFYANWCPTCRPVDREIQANSDKIPEALTIIRVNYNDTETDEAEKELARKYNITYQHTFVLIDESGNEVAKWNGGGLDEILNRL